MPVSDNDVKETLSEKKLSAEALERLTAFFSILIEVDRKLKTKLELYLSNFDNENRPIITTARKQRDVMTGRFTAPSYKLILFVL